MPAPHMHSREAFVLEDHETRLWKHSGQLLRGCTEDKCTEGRPIAPIQIGRCNFFRNAQHARKGKHNAAGVTGTAQLPCRSWDHAQQSVQRMQILGTQTEDMAVLVDSSFHSFGY